ncbi:MAG: argininosuccinate lyase [bacterium]|jgi:argininosuccinate lyase|nr:argininosuccinate lyase [Spirochaetales bacterium]MDT3390460.1 argininosuccinate lyase [bacterium]
MAKMWAGRTSGEINSLADSFNSSIGFDSRLYRQDIQGSIAHASMLSKQGIISFDEADSIISALQQILWDIESGKLQIDPKAEDIHMFVEEVLTERIGATGKKLHTARSRNDQIALDMRLYLRDCCDSITVLLKDLIKAILDKAKSNKEVIMPGYTHLQHAQPVLFSHYILAYAMMFTRDIRRIDDCRKRINVSPIGSCALAGTTFSTDRQFEAEQLDFDSVCLNSMDAVSDRDFCVEFLSALSIIMMHLSRLSEELILWSSQEFGFVEMSNDFSTGSSIMPQKKNPDMAELCRGKTGRVYGDLMGLLTTLKGLPLAYNKDMQEDKEGVFDACDTARMCLKICAPMISTMKVNADAMTEAAKKGFMNATDLADYLVLKGIPFRDAYKISGNIVAYCIKTGHILEDLPLEDYLTFSKMIGSDVYDAVDLANCVSRRTSQGGTSVKSVEKQIAYLEGLL